jgi:hypothetical protein
MVTTTTPGPLTAHLPARRYLALVVARPPSTPSPRASDAPGEVPGESSGEAAGSSNT